MSEIDSSNASLAYSRIDVDSETHINGRPAKECEKYFYYQ